MSARVASAWALLGRDAETTRLAALINGSDEGTVGAILVLGDRGCGRTAVLNGAIRRADRVPLRLVALGEGSLPDESRSDYDGLVHALAGAAGDADGAALVSVWLPVLTGAANVPPYEVARQLLAGARSQPGPFPPAIVVDDVHLLDRPSQLVLGYLAYHGSAVGLRSLFSADQSADLRPFDRLEQLPLRGLTVAELRLVLEQRTNAPLPYRVAEVLHTWTGGNPVLALDVCDRLSPQERLGSAPIGLPLVPTAAAVSRLGERVLALAPDEQRLLAVFARLESLPVEFLPVEDRAVLSVPAEPAVGPVEQPDPVDRLVTAAWLAVDQGVVLPCRRADALVAWATLTPSAQQELHRRLADALQSVAPALADYFAALGGNAAAADRLVHRTVELIAARRPQLAAPAASLCLRRGVRSDAQTTLLLAQLLTAEGYVAAAHEVLMGPGPTGLPPAAVAALWAELAAMGSDPTDARAQIDVTDPPTADLDQWLTAVLTICRVQLGLDGPAESAQLLESVRPVLPRASAVTLALSELVAAECDVYLELPGSAAALDVALDRWTTLRARSFDLGTVAAAFDLLGLGRPASARDLVASVGPTPQLPYATARAAVLTVRVEAEIALGQFRRAAVLLVEAERTLPSPSSADQVLASQAVRIGAVCDDLPECRVIEDRLRRSTGIALSYPARRAHTAALGFRQLVLGNYRQSRDLLVLALQGPALILQGRSCVLADLVEATVSAGRRREAADLLARHGGWLPDRDGDRSAGLLARCRAMVADDDDVDRLFAAAARSHAPHHETDRARTLLAYGRTLAAVGRTGDAAQRLTEAAEVFRELRLTGWLRHVQRLQLQLSPVPDDPVALESELTEIESQIVAMVMQRKRNREIAAALYVSLRTVEGHLTRIFHKLGVSTKSQLFRELSSRDSATGEPA